MAKQVAIQIDTEKIPRLCAVGLAEGALKLVELAFSAPDAEERYQKWLEDRRKRKEAEKCSESS